MHPPHCCIFPRLNALWTLQVLRRTQRLHSAVQFQKSASFPCAPTLGETDGCKNVQVQCSNSTNQTCAPHQPANTWPRAHHRYRHGAVFKQCQPIKAVRKPVQVISPQSHCSLKLAGLKPPCGSNLWKTLRPPKNVAMVNETERERGRRKGQTNTSYIPRAREGNLPRC